MTVEWLVYAWLVSSLVSVAAWLAERGARARRWPTRWVWLGAMAVSLAVPVMAWLSPVDPAGGSPSVVGAAGWYVLESLPSVGVASEPDGLALATVALAGWAVVSALLLLLVGVAASRQWLARRGWPSLAVDGVEVLVSGDTGPAAIGILRARVVVPGWALGLDAERRRLLLMHEAEHVRARDPQLTLMALLACVAVPWNVPLWWQLRRLRLAVEVDCDGRVMRRRADPRLYGSLLLTVAQRRVRLALALAEPTTMLERRIRMIASMETGRGWLRALAPATVSALVLAVACGAPGPRPDAPAPEPVDPPVEADAVPVDPPVATEPIAPPERSLEELAEKPTITPFTDPPRLTELEAVRDLLQERYPAALREAGITGRVNVWFFIDETGTVAAARVNRSSGYPAMDEAALSVAREMTFTPARHGEEPVPVWVALDITFERGD